MEKATVRLVGHGEKDPYCIEVVTPGWRGCDHALEGTIRDTMPADLREICAILKKEDVKYFSVSEAAKEGVMMFLADGATEFVLRDAASFERAVNALTRAGWLSPEIQNTAIH
jgi:hypothetical protein